MFNAIGAHVYAGGFTIGVREHFNVLAHLEHAAYGKEVVNLNYPDLPIYDGGPANWPKTWPKGSARPRFLYANPPCAIWSGASAGRVCPWQEDPRLQFHRDIFHYALDDVEVDVLAMESVPPSFVKGRDYVNDLIAKAAERGYSTTVAKHNAKWFGVAQNRSRIFYVFHKVAIPWTHPEFTEPKTVRQALKGIRSKRGGYDTTINESYAKLVAQAAPGEGLARVFQRLNPSPEMNHLGKVKGRPSFLDGRLPWDKPANVVIAGKPIHPEENRYLSQEETAAICGFPKDYRWPKGSFVDITGYMSRGIMPPVGAWLADNVKRALEMNKRLNTQTASVLDVSVPPGEYYAL